MFGVVCFVFSLFSDILLHKRAILILCDLKGGQNASGKGVSTIFHIKSVDDKRLRRPIYGCEKVEMEIMLS